jgi:hypothetical protein
MGDGSDEQAARIVASGGRPRISEERARSVLLAVVAALCAALVVGKVTAAGPADAQPGGAASGVTTTAGSLFTEDLVRLVAAAPKVTRAHGAHVGSDQIVVSVEARDIPLDGLSGWVSDVLYPLLKQAPREVAAATITMLFDVTGSDSYARTVVVPVTESAGLPEYRFVPGARGESSAGSAAPTASEVGSGSQSSTETTLPPPSIAMTANEPASPADTAPSSSAPTASAPVALPATASAAALPAIPTSSAPGAPSSGDAPSTAATGEVPVSVAAATPLGKEDFTTASTNWIPLAGQWKFLDGAYQQVDNSGYDYINQYSGVPETAFVLSAKMRALEGSDLNAGFVIFQPKKGRRNGATLIDLTDKGGYVRWGHYDNGGVYVFEGGNRLTAPVNGVSGVTLKVMVKDAIVRIYLDDKQVGEFATTKSGGTVGIVTSVAKVAFDDVALTAA